MDDIKTTAAEYARGYLIGAKWTEYSKKSGNRTKNT